MTDAIRCTIPTIFEDFHRTVVEQNRVSIGNGERKARVEPKTTGTKIRRNAGVFGQPWRPDDQPLCHRINGSDQIERPIDGLEPESGGGAPDSVKRVAAIWACAEWVRHRRVAAVWAALGRTAEEE